MAILEKRRAVNQLPRFQRYQDTRAGDRAAALRGETPITSAIRQLAGSSGYGPMGESEGYLPMGGGMGGGRGGAGGVGGMGAGPMGGGAGGAGAMGGAGKGTVDKFGNMAGQPKTAVTSALKGSTGVGKTTGATTGKTTGTGATAGKVAGTTAAGTTSKLPGLTSKVAGTTGTAGGTGAKTLTSAGTAGAKTLTSTGSGTAKTTGTTGTTGAKTTGSAVSGLGKTLTSALTGAALGAGTKFVIDKLTGGTKTAGTAGTGTTKGTGTAGTGTAGTGTTKGTGTAGTGSTVTTKGGTGTAGTGTTKTTGTAGTGTTKTTGTAGTGTTKTTGTAGTGTTKAGTGVTSVIKGTGTAGTTKTGVGTPPFVPKSGTGTIKTVGPKTPVTKTATKTAPKTGGAGSKATAPATKGVTAKTAADIKAENPELTDEEVEAELDRIAAESDDYSTVPEEAIDNGDGTYSETVDGMVTTYDADGNIIGMEAAEDATEGDEDGTEDDGTTTQVLEDGTVVTLDENGEIVSYTDTDGSVYDADGNEITEGGGDLDAGGNTTETLEDGTVVTYDSSGDIVSYTDSDGVTYDGDGEVIDGSDTLVNGDEDAVTDEEDIVADEEDSYEGLYSDDEGNLYDPDGNLVQYADGTMVGEEEEFTEGEVAFTDEYGNTYDYNGDLIAEADHSDFVQYDEDGNSYDWDGNLIEYAEGYGAEDEYAAEDEYTADDEYSSEDEYSYEDDYSYDDYDVKKGGLIHMQEGGDPSEGDDEEIEPIEEEENEDGTITQYFDDGSSITYDADGEVVDVTEATDEAEPAFATRSLSARDPNYSDTTEEVQDFQNVDYNFGESDDPTMTGYTLTGNRNPVGNTYRSEGQGTGLDFTPEGWPEGFVSNGDGTATYVDDDGSTVTIDEDSNIVFVTDANGEVVAQDGEAVTTGGLTQAGQGNRQYFDDGSSIETFDDGSQIVYDSDGNVFRSVDAYETTYDDEGNAIVTDGFGNIVGVYDPQGNVIPLGGGRVTGPTSITGAGGGGGTDITQDPTIRDRIADQNLDRDTRSAIDSLLAGLNTYGGAGAAGAVLGALLGNTDLFGGDTGGGGGGGGFDMGGVGAINPRTTDFGIGPANYVGYDQYGTPEQMPELYGRELYQNLNAPGFNEVNPGDYARYDAEESGLDQFIEGDEQDQEVADEQAIEGGLAGMADGGDAMAAWVAAQPDLANVADPMARKDALESWQKQRPGYVDPMDYNTYDEYAGAADIDTQKDAGSDLQNRANFYGMTIENYQNALSGDQTKPMGQFQQVYGNELLSPVEQVAAQTARAQGLGAPSKLAVEQIKKNPAAFNDASKKWHDYIRETFPETAEYSSVLAGPMEYSATGVKAPKVTGTENAYIIDPRTKTLVKNPKYKPFGMADGGLADGGMPQGGLGQTSPQTYYTFGKPVDPLQNLRNPAPFQQQPQMPPQAAQSAQQTPPQQALPQMGMAPTQPSIPQGVPPAGVGMKSGGLPAWSNVPITQGRLNFRQGAAVHGAGDGQSDDIPAMLADGEYVIDAETVAQIGNGSTKAGAQALDKFRENIRAHKRSAPINKIPPKTKTLTSYLKGAR